MSIECTPSNLCSDVRCAVCGQGFLVVADRVAHTRQGNLRHTVQDALRRHHISSEHPAGSFLIDTSDEADRVRA